MFKSCFKTKKKRDTTRVPDVVQWVKNPTAAARVTAEIAASTPGLGTSICLSLAIKKERHY